MGSAPEKTVDDHRDAEIRANQRYIAELQRDLATEVKDHRDTKDELEAAAIDNVFLQSVIDLRTRQLMESRR